MLDLATGRRHLARAEIHIAEGERRIDRQAALVARLRRSGQNAAQAEALLTTLRQTLASWQGHRDAIRRIVADLEGAASRRLR
jgi:hypothetical protein